MTYFFSFYVLDIRNGDWRVIPSLMSAQVLRCSHLDSI